MRIRYWNNEETGEPHIYDHGVVESEVEEVFAAAGLEWGGPDGSRSKIGRTKGGRYLQIVFRREDQGDVFVISAYTPKEGAMKAFRRHLNKKA